MFQPMISESAFFADATLTTELLDVLEGKVALLDPWDFIALRNFELSEVGMHSMSHYFN